MSQQQAGKMTAARRVGLTLEDYEKQRALGLKWCAVCKAWHERDNFGNNRARTDGLQTFCKAGNRVLGRRRNKK